MRAQGFDRRKLIYHSNLQPWLSYWGLFWTTLFILINGYAVFWDFNASGFLTAYINIPLFIALYAGWKLLKRLLAYEGAPVAATGSPRDVVKAAAAIYDFMDEDVWLSMLRDRNKTMHIYDAAEAAGKSAVVWHEMVCS